MAKPKLLSEDAPRPGTVSIHCTGTASADIDQLTPFQGAFKTLSNDDYSRFRQQIAEQGITAACTIWKQPTKPKQTLALLDGHQRHETLKRMRAEGWKVPPIPINFTACKDEAHARRVVLGLASTYGTVNADELAPFAKLAGLSLPQLDDRFTFPDLDLKGMIRSEAAAALSMGNEPDLPPRPKKPKTKLGDLWKLGPHRLVCGDSTDPKVYAKLMGKDKATVVFTDPPYGVSIGKKNAMLNEMLKEMGKGGRNQQSIEADDLTPDALKAVLLGAFTEARKAMADDCSVFVCSPQGGGLGMMMMMMMMMEADLEVRHILNWIKSCPTFSMGRLDYDYQHEPILFTWTKTHKRKKEGAFQTSLWTVDKPRESKLHPTMKPVELPVCAILNHSDPGDLVLDIFGGSGTTLLAAERTDRSGRLVELDPGYCDVIVQRWEGETGKKAERS